MKHPSRPDLLDPAVNPRVAIAALWTAILFVFVYVDLFGLYRSDMRAEIESGTIAQFTIGPGFLLGVTTYVAIPSVLLALTLLLPARVVRWANVITAALYVPTIIHSAIGEWGYFVLGSVIEVVLLAVIVRLSWSWPRRWDGEGDR